MGHKKKIITKDKKTIAIFSPNKSIQGDSCLLGISIGQPYYEGTSLTAICDLIKNSAFGSRYLMVADGLNAYNKLIDNPNYSDPAEDDLLINDLDKTSKQATQQARTQAIQQARTEAIQDGQNWLDSPDGKKLLQDPSMQWTRVIRWADILSHSDFKAAKERIDQLYVWTSSEKRILERDVAANNTASQIARDRLSFFTAVGRAVGFRVQSIRTKKLQAGKLSEFDANKTKIISLVIKYLLEESAAEIVIANQFPCTYELYPKKMNDAIEWVHKHIIAPNILQWLIIDIKDVQESPNSKHTRHNSISSNSSVTTTTATPDTTSDDENTKPSSSTQISMVTSDSMGRSSATKTLAIMGIFSCPNSITTTSVTSIPNISVSYLRDELLLRSVAVNGNLIYYMNLLSQFSDNAVPSSEQQKILKGIANYVMILPTNTQPIECQQHTTQSSQEKLPTAPQLQLT